MEIDLAVYEGRLDVLDGYLKNGGDVNALVWDGASILHGAVTCVQFEMVKLLFEYKADVNMPDSSGITPLYRAILQNHCLLGKQKTQSLAIIKFLIANGADLRAVTGYGVSIYQLVKRCEQEEILEILHKKNIIS